MLIPQRVTAGSDTNTRTTYSQKVAGRYSYRFGMGKPFLPSNIETDNGEFIDPKNFPTAQYCGHCHQEAQHQWRQSAHSNANRAPWYLRNVNLLNDTKGVELSRHCEGCHDPVAMVAGNLTPGSNKRHPFDDDGVTCMVCHSIQEVDTRGTGSYVLGVPAVLLDDNGRPISRPVTDGEILSHLDRHSAAVMKPFYKTSEFCAVCHKAALPKQLNDYKWQRAISLYDEWQGSSFSGESPLPFYKKGSSATCERCHMRRESIKLPDPGAKNGELASHRWLGANTVIPKYYGFDEQASRIVQFLQAGIFNIDIFALERGSSAASHSMPLIAPLGVVPYTIERGELLTVDVVIQNKGIAHAYVPEQRDMYQSWVDFTVNDETGKTLFESGFIRLNGDLDEGAHTFTNRLINARGGLNSEHQVWDTKIVAYNNTIQSGRSQVVRYAFHVPSNGSSLTLTATVRYRRFNQHFMDFGMNMPIGKHYDQPVIDLASASYTIRVGKNIPTPTASDNPEWMRWNNYGIALLDAHQYTASLRAFDHVAQLRPDYGDAFTNQALVEIEQEKYAEARPYLEQALELSRDDARALYYSAVVASNLGEIISAAKDLKIVLSKFPRSRDAHRELGFCFYEEHEYTQARAEFEAVQKIDPEDLAAHYMLSILYRRFGLNDKAAAQASTFKDQEDDPSANIYAISYLRGHRQIGNESSPWHVHLLDAPSTTLSEPPPTSFGATQN